MVYFGKNVQSCKAVRTSPRSKHNVQNAKVPAVQQLKNHVISLSPQIKYSLMLQVLTIGEA